MPDACINLQKRIVLDKQGLFKNEVPRSAAAQTTESKTEVCTFVGRSPAGLALPWASWGFALSGKSSSFKVQEYTHLLPKRAPQAALVVCLSLCRDCLFFVVKEENFTHLQRHTLWLRNKKHLYVRSYVSLECHCQKPIPIPLPLDLLGSVNP